MTRGWLVLCVLLSACNREAPKPEASAAPAAKPEAKPAAPKLTTWPGVAALRGELRGEGGVTPKAGDAIAHDDKLTLAAGGTALIELDADRQVELVGPASIYLFAEGTLGVIEGGARLAVSTQAPRAVPLRVVTAHATLSLGPGTEAWAQVIPALGSYVTMLRGAARLTNGEEAPAGGPQALGLTEGRAVFVTRNLPDTSEQGPSTLADAQSAGQTHLQEAAAIEPPLGDGGDELEATLSAMTAAQAEGQKKAAEQRKAKLAGKEAKANGLRQELVEHARALHNLRALATVRFERFRVRTLHLRETIKGRFAPFEGVAEQLFPNRAQADTP